MKHTQSAGGIVIGPHGKILVVNQDNISWSLPKGHIDPGEDARAAAEREVKEETGVVQLQFIKDLGSYQRHRIGLHEMEDVSELKTIHFFLYKTPQIDLQPEDSRHPEARWIEPKQVSNLLTHPKDKEFFEGVLSDVLATISGRE